MSASVTLKAVGLNRSPNPLDLPPGSLLEASNVIIKRDGIIESRRGYPLYGNSLGTNTDRAKQLMTYKNRILRHFSDTLEYDSDGAGTFLPFCGNYLEPATGRRIRFIESNGNFYFTTADGIKKIAARTAADFTTACPFITQAGGIKALDLSSFLKITPGNEAGILPQDSATAYRVVWGNTDINGNLVLGSPSPRSVIFNPLIDLELIDFNRLLNALDQVSDNSAFPSLISDGDYVSTLGLPPNSSPNELLNSLIALTEKIDADILYANDTGVGVPLTISTATITTGVATINFSAGNPQNYVVSGSNIFLAGFTTTTGTINGPQVVASVSPTTLTFNTTATGTVTVTGSSINSYEYEILAIPSQPSTPATDAQLVAVQVYMSQIITRLQSEPSTGTPPTISSDSATRFIDILQLTTTASVMLKFTIPQGVTTDDFFQIYRSEIDTATGTQVLSLDISPSDEMKLVFEGFPTATDISNGFIEIEDVTPPEFAGAFLYTNSTTGEGILQANDLPPFALDINRFKNVVFYANTRTRHRLSISLLGVLQMIADYNNSITPTITIADSTHSDTYTFVTGVQEIIKITTVADVAGSLAGKYFTFNSANDQDMYYIWYKVAGVGTDPAVSGKFGIQVDLNTGDSANTVASKTFAAIQIFVNDFTASVSTNIITVTNNEQGSCTAPTAGTSGFTTAVFQTGRGQNASIGQVLLSTAVSPAQAVDETARSLVNVINSDPNGIVYAFYLSTGTTVPGQILFESRTLNNNPFYVLGNDDATGQSFNPDISPSIFISTISIANPTVITTSTPHGLINQNQIIITNSNSTPSVDGVYTITYISPTTFSIPVNVTIAGTRGALRNTSTAVTSDNEVLANRIYFSKVGQPEAVPLVNTIDVGAKDKAILRIFPLRDSLFVYKEDGLFRISGESDPFNLALFDSSCILLAPDSLDVSNNLIYGWSTQGVISTSESGVNIISRPIDTDILKLATQQYTNFKSATWGIGYESDNSYTTYTIQETDDVYATIGYRYSTLTNTWTTFAKTNTCGVINSFDDKQYLGAGDVNFIEKERKDFTRYDYADREYEKPLETGHYYGNQLQLLDVNNVSVGDVIVQDQTVSVYSFNNTLEKLDRDVSLSPHTYVTNNTLAAGADIRPVLDGLIAQIAADPGRQTTPGFTPGADYLVYQAINTIGTITANSAGDPTVITATAHGLQTGRIITITGSNSTPSIDGTFSVTVLTANSFTIPVIVSQPGTTGSFSVNNEDFLDIETSYNGMINLLNSDLGVNFNNYMLITYNTSQEAIIIAVDVLTKKVTLNYTLDFVAGPMTVFQAIQSIIQWAPQTFGDPLNLKHIREATLMFEDKTFTQASLSFSSDLLPAFQEIPFAGMGNGIFGYTGIPAQYNGVSGGPGFGYSFFGGGSHAAPFRTYIPRDLQRCRFLNSQFDHMTAREKYSITGLTLTGEISQSSRAYR